MSEDKKCYFTQDIGEGLSCSDIEDNFDEYGFTIKPCSKYPCDKINKYRMQK